MESGMIEKHTRQSFYQSISPPTISETISLSLSRSSLFLNYYVSQGKSCLYEALYSRDCSLEVQSLQISISDSNLTSTFFFWLPRITAENLAQKYGITREQCDAFALQSQQRWQKAHEEGAFKDEIVPVEIKVKKVSSKVAF